MFVFSFIFIFSIQLDFITKTISLLDQRLTLTEDRVASILHRDNNGSDNYNSNNISNTVNEVQYDESEYEIIHADN